FNSSKAWTREEGNEYRRIEMCPFLPEWRSAMATDAGTGVLRRELHSSAGQDRIRARAGSAALQYQSRCATRGANRCDHERGRIPDTTFRVRSGVPAQGRSEAHAGPAGRKRQ